MVISWVGPGFFKCWELLGKFFWVNPEILWMFDFVWNLLRKQWNILRKNMTFWEKWNILRKTRLFLREIRLFVRKNHFCLSILPVTLVFALSFCHLDLTRKNGTCWEKSGYFWEKSGYFWETYGSNQNSGRALCEKTVSLASKASTFKSSTKWSSPKCLWWCHKWHTENVEKQDLQEALGQVASGKRFLQESLPIPNFRKCFKKYVFFQETSSFWLLGNAKNPTDLKPYWSRAGLRHPEEI